MAKRMLASTDGYCSAFNDADDDVLRCRRFSRSPTRPQTSAPEVGRLRHIPLLILRLFKIFKYCNLTKKKMDLNLPLVECQFIRDPSRSFLEWLIYNKFMKNHPTNCP